MLRNLVTTFIYFLFFNIKIMEFDEIQEIAIIYGKKDLIEEFLEIFNMDRMHDGAPINTIQIKGEMKKEIKKFIWKGD